MPKKKRTTKDTVEEIKEAASSGNDLTLKQQAFVRAYFETGNATEAYRRAYDAQEMSDDAIRVEACRLLKHPNIALRLNAHNRTAMADTQLTLEEHMAELRTLRDQSKQNGQMSAAIKAEELRGKLRRFYVEQVEHGDAGDFDRLSDEELRTKAAEIAKKLNLTRPGRHVNGNGSDSNH